MATNPMYPLLVTEAELALLSRLLADEAVDATLDHSFPELWDVIVLLDRVTNVRQAVLRPAGEASLATTPEKAA